MSKRIIAISRQFGSGGRSVAKELATRLGIAYYDKELVEQVALESGFAPKYVEEHGEHSPGRSMLSYAFAPQGVPGVMNGLSTADFLWSIQCGVILQLADKGQTVDRLLNMVPETMDRISSLISKDKKPAEPAAKPEEEPTL